MAQVAQVPGLEEAQAILTGLQAALKCKQVTSVAQQFLPNRSGDMKIARVAGKLNHLPPPLPLLFCSSVHQLSEEETHQSQGPVNVVFCK